MGRKYITPSQAKKEGSDIPTLAKSGQTVGGYKPPRASSPLDYDSPGNKAVKCDYTGTTPIAKLTDPPGAGFRRQPLMVVQPVLTQNAGGGRLGNEGKK